MRFTAQHTPPKVADAPVRLVLAFLNATTFAQLALSLRARYGAQTRTFFVLLSLTAFHFPYYAGRTLPNFLSTPLGA